MAQVIQSLWVGGRLSTLEQLAIRSFQAHGHEFVLYAYEDTEGVPPGTVVMDANSILPASRIFTYREHQSYAGFANFFRYKLLLEKGGWFVDADMVCLRPFNFQDEYVFSSEGLEDRQLVNVGAIKAPAGSAILEYAWNACEQMDPAALQWSQCGPRLFGRAVEAHALHRHVQPWPVFCPYTSQPGGGCSIRPRRGNSRPRRARFTYGTSCGGVRARTKTRATTRNASTSD